MSPSLRYEHDYRNDAALRSAFYALTRAVFGFTLEAWWNAGWWTADYVCHSLLDGDVMVANASTTRMTLRIGGCLQPAIQVGTVSTLPAYRGRGLSRRLMEQVLAAHRDMPMFLFANDSVADFYPRFGFRPGQAQAMPVWNVPTPSREGASADVFQASGDWVRVEPTDARVPQCLAMHRARSRVFDVDSDAIRMFHFIAVHANHLYLSRDGSLLLAATCSDGRLDIYGIFAKEVPDRDALLASLCHPGVARLRFYFEPDGFGLAATRIPHHVENTHLFVNALFPIVNRAWIFPTLACT